MSKKKSTHINNYQDESILDNILWFIENFLPQKIKGSSQVELSRVRYELFTINKIKKFASYRSKFLREDLSKTTLSFTVGNWALPYLNFFKRIKLLK